MSHKTRISAVITDAIRIKSQVLADEYILSQIEQIVAAIVNAYKQDKKVLFCGNGGSAADAQHLSTELSGRFYLDRKPLNAEALNVNSSYITAAANDYSFSEVYARLVQGFGRKGDVLVALSTSGNSHNIIKALQMAKDMELITVGLSGGNPAAIDNYSDYLIKIPSTDTPRIQEAHMLVGHIICELVERELFA